MVVRHCICKIEDCSGKFHSQKMASLGGSPRCIFLEGEVLKAAQETPVLAILGPRQSGKTALAKQVFPGHVYLNLEDLGMRDRALADPKAFLQDFSNGAGLILDEIQQGPELFSYIQVLADEIQRDGYFVLSGFQNFCLTKGISQ